MPTPEEAEAFRLKLADPNAPDTRTLGQRVVENAGRLADNPVVRFAALGPILGPMAAGLPSMTPSDAPPPGPALGALQTKLGQYQKDGMDGVQAQTSTVLRPMYTPDVTVNGGSGAPTLDPNYGMKLRMPQIGGGGFGGLQGKLDAARKHQDDLIGDEAAQTRGIGHLQAQRTEAVAGLEQDQAAKQQAAAEKQAQVDADAQTRLQSFLKRQEDMTDELGKMKVDTRKLFRNADSGTQFSMFTGAILGGMLGAEHGTGNSSLDRLDKIIDRDIKVQQDEIDNKKAQIGARNSLFGQMLSEVGDTRVAAAAVRNQMYEAAKLSIKAKADSLGTPEIRAKAELAANGIEQKQAGLRTQIAEGAMRAAQAAAAAAAAAREKAERDAREWALKIAELGLKKDELEIKKLDAGGVSVKDDNAAVSKAADKFGEDKVIANRPLILRMKEKIRSDGTIVGLDRAASLKEKLARYSPTGLFANDDTIKRMALSDEELVSQGDWQKLALVFQNKTTGTGGSDGQMEKIQKAYEGAKTPAERRTVINDLNEELGRREKLPQVGLDDRQKALFAERMRREGLVDLPSSVRPKDK